MAVPSVAEAAATVIEALRDLGRVEDVDTALLVAYEKLAAEVDDAETKDRAGLYREFRAYDAAVRALGGDDDGDGIADLLAQLSAPVVNTPAPRPTHQG